MTIKKQLVNNYFTYAEIRLSHQIIQCQCRQFGIVDCESCEGLDGLTPDCHELVLQTVHEGSAGTEAHHVNVLGVQLLARLVVCPLVT